jgi:hypothetical protein
MSEFYLVNLTKEVDVYVIADSTEEAEEMAHGIGEELDWDVHIDGHVFTGTIPKWEYVDTGYGFYHISELDKLREWIDAVEKANAIDPNQGRFFDEFQ